jgi:hypothetical protein
VADSDSKVCYSTVCVVLRAEALFLAYTGAGSTIETAATAASQSTVSALLLSCKLLATADNCSSTEEASAAV